jgi:hypothetical protein
MDKIKEWFTAAAIKAVLIWRFFINLVKSVFGY